MNNNMLQRGVEDGAKNYIAQPKDASLPALLEESFVLLELRFANFGSCPEPLSWEGGACMRLPPRRLPACTASWFLFSTPTCL